MCFQGRKAARKSEEMCMNNSNGDNFAEQDPMAETEFGSETSGRSEEGSGQEGARRFSSAAADTWEQTRRKATLARERTEFFLRENPVPTVLGALMLGLAIGLAIRYASRPEEPEVSVRNSLKEVDWKAMSLPFLWPFFRSVRRGYETSADAVKDGIDRVKEVDVNRYVKPLRKQWKSWTR
jgi:hypothetical protein